MKLTLIYVQGAGDNNVSMFTPREISCDEFLDIANGNTYFTLGVDFSEVIAPAIMSSSDYNEAYTRLIYNDFDFSFGVLIQIDSEKFVSYEVYYFKYINKFLKV